MSLSPSLPSELDTLAGWVACIADARPEADYLRYLEEAGLRPVRLENHDQDLLELVRKVRGRLLTATVLARIHNVSLANVDLDGAARITRHAQAAVGDGLFGYILITETNTTS